jgi:uncharacterized protein with ParB-like and HNH nuclease domain
MDFCFSAWIVLLMGLINTTFDILIFGVKLLVLLMDIFVCIMLVLFTNWLCNNNWYTLSWFLSIAISLITFLGLYLYRTKDPQFMTLIDAQKNKKTTLLKK